MKWEHALLHVADRGVASLPPLLECCSDLDYVRHSTRCGSGAFGAAPSPKATTDIASARNSRSGCVASFWRHSGVSRDHHTSGNSAEGYK